MKRKVKLFVTTLLCCTLLLGVVTQAAPIDSNASEIKKNNEIDKKLEEMNQIVVEQSQLRSIATASDKIYTKDISNELILLNRKKATLESSLAKLNVRKLDSNNTEDMKLLSEIMLSEEFTVNSEFGSAPDLAVFANAFSLYITDGYYTWNGTNYPYRYIRVVGDKTSDRLNINQIVADAIPKSAWETTLGAFINYNLSYVFSAWLAEIPYGNIADWTIGNVFNILSSLPSNSQITSNGNLYTIEHQSSTIMGYIYIYAPSGIGLNWKLIGTNSQVNILRTESLRGFVGAVPINEKIDSARWSSRSGGYWYNYIQTYTPNIHRVDPPGSLQLRFEYSTIPHYFTPAFAPVPANLL